MIGIDIVDIDKINVDKLYKVFTDCEKEYVDSSHNPDRRREVVAGIYAGKEAVFKALALDNLGLEVLKKIEIKHKDNGRPYICYCGENIDMEISISHTNHTAVAVAIDLDNLRKLK